jgi:hypothetical protein
MAKPKDSIMDRARKQVEQQIKLAEDERRKQLIKKRLEFITNGLAAAQQKKYAEAVVYYQSYVKLLEDWKGVNDGALTPSHFDYTREMGDLLMLSGLYWDLAKVFDQTESVEKVKLFHHYMEKFILFSKSTTWEPMCAEQIRRYLLTNRPKHRQEFKNAYKLLGGKDSCFIATALSDEIEFETIPALRIYRDQVLRKHLAGRVFIWAYYKAGPTLANGTYFLPQAVRKTMALCLDRIARKIRTRF